MRSTKKWSVGGGGGGDVDYIQEDIQISSNTGGASANHEIQPAPFSDHASRVVLNTTNHIFDG